MKKGVNLEAAQSLNRALVIRLLRRLKVCSRAELAQRSGLKQSTITNIVGDFIGWELVTELGVIDGKRGRPSIGVALNTSLFKVLAVRLTRQRFSIGLFDLCGAGEVLVQEPLEVFEGSRRAVRRIVEAVEAVLASRRRDRILGIGVAIPGPFFRSEGKIGLMTDFPGWEQIALEDELRAAFRLPVFLEHDANAAALAEWWLGPHGRDGGTMVYVAAGQGIGAGVVIDGRLLRGTLGIAGEIGHMSIAFDGAKCECGNHGCLEHYCSTVALQREVARARVDFPGSPLQQDHSLPAILRALKLGDELAVREVRRAAWYLGLGLVNVVNLFNPDVITIGDDLAGAGPFLLKTVEETVRSHVLPSVGRALRVELSSFKNDPVLVGVGTLVVENLLQEPAALMAPPARRRARVATSPPRVVAARRASPAAVRPAR
jgi:predicted NBD/HSP70 family sugar kinase